MDFKKELQNKNSTQEKLEFLEKLDYRLIIKKNSQSIQVCYPEIGIIESAETLNQAFEKIEVRKRDFFNQLLQNAWEEEIPFPSGKSFFEKSPAYLFFIKAGVVFLLLLFLVTFAAYKLKQVTREFSENINSKIESALDSTPENQEARLKKFRGHLQKMKPFVQEIRKSWAEK